MRNKKLVGAVALWIGLSINANAIPVIDPTNLVQNTITAIQQIASYAKQVSDSVRQIQEFDKHATEFTNETLGLDDLLGDINNISLSLIHI